MTVDQRTTADAPATSTGTPGSGRFSRWPRDLGIGVRLVTRGGRATWTRMAMTAVGVGLGVGMLLLATTVPHILATRSARNDARVFNPAGQRTAHSVLMRDGSTDYRDFTVSGFLIQSESADPVVPAGLTKIPAAGDLVASPKLRELLSSPGGALLRQRLGYRHITGTIARSGLGGPNEYWYYLGSDKLAGNGSAYHVSSFGQSEPSRSLNLLLLLILVTGVSVLLLPVAVFIGAAVRFGAESRDRQQAALRLVGADRQTTRRIAAGEALVGAVLGLVVGTAIFLAGRQLIELVTLDGVSVFSDDVRPDLALASLIVLGLPAAAVVVTMVALRRVVAEPLGVARQAAGRKRQLWWRLLLLVVGLAVLLPLMDGMSRTGSVRIEIEIAGGVVLVLSGLAALLPWGVEALVRRLPGGRLPWQLAVRRLQLDSGSAARVVSGITVAVAGAIALQSLFGSAQHEYVRPGPQDPHRAQMIVETDEVPSAGADQMTARLRSTPGVRSVHALSEAQLTLRRNGSDIDQATSLVVGDCPALREIAVIGRCTDGDAFSVPSSHAGPLVPGTMAFVQAYWSRNDSSFRWRVPGHLMPAGPRNDPNGNRRTGILLTPAAMRRSAMTAPLRPEFYLHTDPGRADAFDQVRTAAAQLDPFSSAIVLNATHIDTTYGVIHRGLLIGSTAVLVLIGASLLVTTLEQLRERRRPLAVLAAFGVRRRTLTLSVLWQTAIPVAVGLLLAVSVGTLLGAVLLRAARQPLWVDWSGTAGILGIGAGVVLLVTLASMPALWRLMRPNGMRTE